jgi:hypothetical protein
MKERKKDDEEMWIQKGEWSFIFVIHTTERKACQ